MALFCAIGSRRAVTVAVVIAIPALSQRHFDCIKRLPGQGGKKCPIKGEKVSGKPSDQLVCLGGPLIPL